eukprot:FR743493.1.p3 GENE.FR743493.1~~FR743493.1.p3  ORF type:complete len:109 (-),score=42.13 FR743493.1:878-1204(-)
MKERGAPGTGFFSPGGGKRGGQGEGGKSTNKSGRLGPTPIRGPPPAFYPLYVFRGLDIFGEIWGGDKQFSPREPVFGPGITPKGAIYPSLKGNKKVGVPPGGGGRFRN